MTSERVSTWSRAFVSAGVGWFVLAQVGALAGLGRAPVVTLTLYGFVFHVVFGKAYTLVPAYFDRELAVPAVLAPHLALATLGVGGLTVAAIAGSGSAELARTVGTVAWAGAAVAFVIALGETIRDNPTGRETGTGGVNEHRARVDRFANAFVPVALAYLAVGSVVPLLSLVGVDPGWLPVGPAQTHLLAAGTATLVLLAVGARLLPRFLVTTPRWPLVAVSLPAAAVGPALLAADFLGGVAFRVGAVALAVAVWGYALTVFDMYRRSDRRRVGFYGVLAGAAAGAVVVAIGAGVALDVLAVETALLDAHARLALTGFLGLSIVGVSYQFYPPAVATHRLIGDRTALAAIALVAAGLTIETVGLVGGFAVGTTLGRVAVALGAVTYAAVVYVVFLERR